MFLGHLLGAVALTRGAWSDPTLGWAGRCCDQEQAIWYLGWTPHALANGLDPFVTTQMGAPAGVNLMWNTPMPLLGLLGWLPARIGGPIFGFNVLMVGGIALSGFTAWLAIRRWTGDGLGPIIGSAVYAFSPYVASHAALHLNLATAWVPPLFLIAIDELLVVRPNGTSRAPWQLGVALGVLSFAQLMITAEVLATSVVAAAVLVCVLACARRDRCRAGGARLAAALAAATGTFLLLAAWPLAIQFFGPQRINERVQDPRQFSTDLLNLVVPTPYQLIAPDAATRVSHEFGGGMYHEATGYLGLPLLILLCVVAVRHWADVRIRVASCTGALLLVFSLGPWLHLGPDDGKDAPSVPLPWLPLGKLPLLEHVLPGRFTLYTWLAVAVIVAIVVARATRLAPRPAVRRLLAVGAALVLILPAPLPRWQLQTPPFFHDWASHHIRPDETVLVAPYFANGDAAPMVWAAVADYGLRMPEAYAYMPQPDGGTRPGPPPTQLSSMMLMIQDDGSPLVARGEDRAQVADDLRAADVHHVILGPMQYWEPMMAFFTGLFGRAPERVGGIAIWRDVHVHGVVAAPTAPTAPTAP